MADIHERVTDLEERSQVHQAGIGELRKDIADLREEMRTSVAKLHTQIGDLRVELHTSVAELRTEIAAVRGEMVHRSDLAELRSEMNQRFLSVDQKFTWLVGIQVAGLVAVVGALVGSYYR
ncbi:MAG TPA: hypothetical protein VIK60_14475 [Vicinamibacterales bacterium]